MVLIEQLREPFRFSDQQSKDLASSPVFRKNLVQITKERAQELWGRFLAVCKKTGHTTVNRKSQLSYH